MDPLTEQLAEALRAARSLLVSVYTEVGLLCASEFFQIDDALAAVDAAKAVALPPPPEQTK